MLRLFSLFLILPFGNSLSGNGSGVKNDLEEPPSGEYFRDAIISEKDALELVEDSSVGEAVDRRPDLDFSNVTIEGETSGVSLDSVSADSVDSVELMKAVTPDLDADVRGGAIVLTYKPEFEQTDVSYQGGVEFSYSSLFEEAGYDFTFSQSGLINQSKRWGGRFSVRLNKLIEGNESITQDWKKQGGDFHLEETERSVYREESQTREIATALDFKASERLYLFLRASLKALERITFEVDSQYRLSEGDYSALGQSRISVAGAQARRGLEQWDWELREIEAVLGGRYKTGNFEVDLKFTQEDLDFRDPIYHTVDFAQNGLDLEFDLNARRYPENFTAGEQDLSDANAYLFEDTDFENWAVEENDEIATLNFKWIEPFGRENTYLKFGLKNRSRDKDQQAGHQIYDEFAGTYALSDVVSDVALQNTFLGDRMLEPYVDAGRSRAYLMSNIGDFTLNERRTREQTDPNTFFVEEEVDSAYVMCNWERGKWRSIVGWRYEDTSVTFRGNEVIIGRDGSGDLLYLATNPTDGKSNYGNNYPNAHFRYRWNDRLTIIGSFTKTIERPGYTVVVPFRRVNLEDRDIEEGNPNLKPTLYTNYDLSLDVGLPAKGLLSLELFHRVIDDFIFDRKSTVVGGVYDGFELERSENSANGEKTGLSVTWRQPIFVRGMPDGLSFNINYKYQESEIEYPDRPGVRLPLTRTPENALRWSIEYETMRFFAQLKGEYADDVMLAVSEDSTEDRFRKANWQLGFNLNYRLRKNVRIYADISNLGGQSEYDDYEGEPTRPIGHRNRPWVGALGVKFEL